MYIYTATTSDAEGGRTCLRRPSELSWKRPACVVVEPNTYHLDTLIGSTPSIRAFSSPSRDHWALLES